MKQESLRGSGLSPFFVPEDFLPSRPSVKQDLNTDILIIGGGLSGLLCAYTLLKAGRGVTLVTSNTVGDGASRFCSGTVTGDGGVDLRTLMDTVGREQAVAWYRLAASAVEQLEKIISDTGSKCDFRRRGSFYYTSFPKEASALREEYLLRHHIGMDCRWMGAEECEEMFSFPCVGGLWMSDVGAELNGVKLCRDLADWITLHGGAVYEGSRVDVIETMRDGGYLCRCGEASITAKGVVDARGCEILKKRPQLGRRVTVFSIATEPISVFRGWPDHCLIKSRDDFSYLRTTSDGRILYTGELSASLTPEGRMGGIDANVLCRVKYGNLEEELKGMFYGIPRIKREYSFCQSLVLTKKGLPYLGRDPQWKGLCYLYAFGECGLAGAVVGSAWISRMLCDPKIQGPEYLTLP
ncbi:MAG: FAD-binding oxidoreductase [Clostridia bacterium]|nr:FAD-binding oxidoreductase [Clostridia bacterium]